MDRVIRLAEASPHASNDIGGKAASLSHLLASECCVPEALVLPVGWFADWWQALESSDAWANFLRLADGPWREACEALQSRAAQLAISEGMRASLDEVRQDLTLWSEEGTVAVRSSSPDEDLESASFAGCYETMLGVKPAELEEAVRTCFVSCLGERVVLYKLQHGLEIHRLTRFEDGQIVEVDGFSGRVRLDP